MHKTLPEQGSDTSHRGRVLLRRLLVRHVVTHFMNVLRRLVCRRRRRGGRGRTRSGGCWCGRSRCGSLGERDSSKQGCNQGCSKLLHWTSPVASKATVHYVVHCHNASGSVSLTSGNRLRELVPAPLRSSHCLLAFARQPDMTTPIRPRQRRSWPPIVLFTRVRVKPRHSSWRGGRARRA